MSHKYCFIYLKIGTFVYNELKICFSIISGNTRKPSKIPPCLENARDSDNASISGNNGQIKLQHESIVTERIGQENNEFSTARASESLVECGMVICNPILRIVQME